MQNGKNMLKYYYEYSNKIYRKKNKGRHYADI